MVLEFMADIARFLRISRLRLGRFFTEVINDQFRNEEAEAHRQNNKNGDGAISDRRAHELPRPL